LSDPATILRLSFAGLKSAKTRRARALWNGEAARIDSHEMDCLRIEARRSEHLRTATQLDGAANALLALDYDPNREEIARIRAAADQYRDLARSEGAA
jgi:hypothetical protein